MIGNIENAIVERIKAASDSNALGYQIKTVKSYGGEFSAEISRAIAIFPAVLVVYVGGSVVKSSRNAAAIRHTFGVMVCAESLRNEKAARHGAPARVGSYQMVNDVIHLLIGQQFEGVEMTPLAVRAIRSLLNDRPDQQLASIYAIDLETETSLSMPEVTGLDDFKTFNANWDVPVHGNVSTELPADDTADATDNIQLEQ